MTVSTDIAQQEWLAQLPQTPASDVKKLGWRGVMKALRHDGKIVVTNHNEPEAVILSTDEYAQLMQAAHRNATQTEDTLTALRQRFDQRLAALQVDDTADRLRDVMRAGAKLAGQVKVGASY